MKNDSLEYYDKMIYHILKKYNLYDRREDFIDLGYIGIAKAILKFDSDKGVKEATYVYACIKNEILLQVRKEKCKKRQVDIIHIENTSLENISNETNLEEDIMSQEDKDKLYKVLFKLPICDYQQYIIYQVYFNNKTKKQLSQHLGISISKINKLQKKAINTMRELYNQV